MSAALATPDQIRAIQTVRRRAGLDEPAYRDMLAGYGVASCKHLTVVAAATLLDRLNGSARASNAPQGGRPARARATGPFAAKLQVLWISAHNLGVVRDPDDAAMMHFVERQTGIPHTRFLRDPIDASKAIEAVKAMLARDGGVVWPQRKGPGSIELKRAVVAAQYQRLADLGRYPELRPFATLTGPELDALSKRLGAVLRPALPQQEDRNVAQPRRLPQL